MLLEISQFANQNKKESEPYVWRMEMETWQKIKKVAEENKCYPSVIMRYIINWACDKMESDEEFRNHILDITLQKNSYKNMRRYMYTISKNVNDKLVSANRKYRIHNINFFVVESVRLFFEEN